MVVHPAAGHAAARWSTRCSITSAASAASAATERPGIVHRLDRGTSGVMVIAKHDRAHRALARQFHDREVGKEYVALVWGTPRTGQALDARSAAIRGTASGCRAGRAARKPATSRGS